jgi:hypothetical protein
MPGESTRSSVVALALAAFMMLGAVFLGGPLPARAAAPITLPDMVIMVPTDLISIGTDPSSGDRDLRFTHITADIGAGPFEIDPHYDSTTGIARFTQEIYNSPSPGAWSPDHSVPVAAEGVWDPPSDYAFPLTKFTLNNVNADGSIGSVVATSPKADYCITGDAFVGGVPNAPNQTSPPPSNCTDPTKPLGWSVGWGDQYDQTDSGQPIDLTGVTDGTYILHAIVDPLHVLTESDTNNDVTDTKLQISGNSVSVLSQTHPVTTPPTVSLTGPSPGAQVSGSVTLTASASATAPATVASVQFLLDGQTLGSPIAAPPFAYTWTVGSTPPGGHMLSARATDSDGNVATATPVSVVVVPPPPSGTGSGAMGGGTGGSGIGASTRKVQLFKWRHGVLTLVVRGLPRDGRLSVELQFAHGRPRFVNARGGRLRLRTARPRAVALRAFIGKRQVGGTLTLRLGKPPTVRIVNPIAQQTLSGTVPIVADAIDDTSISSVRFLVDGRPLQARLTHPPYVIRWDTTHAASGEHRISVLATDPAGNQATAELPVSVQNPRPPMTCFVLQAHVSAEGRGVATTPALHTASPSEILLAFVSANGPGGAGRQTAAVTGAGLRWELVERANEASGDSEVWMARARNILTQRKITATLSDSAYDESLTVIGMEGVAAVGSRARASASAGVPHAQLTTNAATSLVFAVGNETDPARASVLPSGWVPLDRSSGALTSNAFWSQYTNQPTGPPGSIVTVDAARPATGGWNLAAVELENSGD